jgi:hypothetical protein
VPILSTLQAAFAGVGGIDRVAVVAHSVSTSKLAREVRVRSGWAEVKPREAQCVLVTCRSETYYPLNRSYDSFRELDNHAARQLNIVGSYYHVYIYRINDDLTLTEVRHQYFAASN